MSARWWLQVSFATTAAAVCVLQPPDVVQVRHVVDGDTLAIEMPALPEPLRHQALSLRVRGVDTPESGGRAHCESERERARMATEFTRRQLATGTLRVELCAWDKYGGRVLRREHSAAIVLWSGGTR